MARVLTDIVRPEVRRTARAKAALRRRAARAYGAPSPSPDGTGKDGPTSLTVFYDGGAGRVARRVAALRHALGRARTDVLFRDLRRFPLALTCWHVAPEDWAGRLFVVDRTAALRRGADALRLLRRETDTSRRSGPLEALARALAAALRPFHPHRSAH